MLPLPGQATNVWLPPGLSPTPSTRGPGNWVAWRSSQGTPHWPRYADVRSDPSQDQSDPRRPVAAWNEAQVAERVYASLDALAEAFHAQLASLTDTPEFPTWRRQNPTYKPRLCGFLATAHGPRRITILLDTGATHCFICARLAAALNLAPSGEAGPSSVTTAAATDGPRGLAAPVRIYLSLGDTFRESMSVSAMDMDVGDDLILGWDWISSHDLCHLFVPGKVSVQSGPARLQLDLLPAAARPPVHALSVIGHGEFRRLLRQIERTDGVIPDPNPELPRPPQTLATRRQSSTG